MKKHLSWFRVSLLALLAGYGLGRYFLPNDLVAAWVIGGLLLLGVQNEWLSALGRNAFSRMPLPNRLPEARFWRSCWFIRIYVCLQTVLGLVFGAEIWEVPVWLFFHGYLVLAWVLNAQIAARAVRTLGQKKWANPGEFALLGVLLLGGAITGAFTAEARRKALDQ